MSRKITGDDMRRTANLMREIKHVELIPAEIEEIGANLDSLESENAALKQEIERLQTIRLNAAEAHLNIQTQLVMEIEQLRADNVALLELMKWYAGGSEDGGERAREYLQQIGGNDNA